MTSTRIHGEVTYYDQLGVSRNATIEEIRHAYRGLVRILHPDQQLDPELKQAAERQLRKLNRIHSVLVDPEKRRAYDRYLNEEAIPDAIEVDTPAVRVRKTLIRASWAAGAFFTVAFLFWLGSESSPVEPILPPQKTPSPAPLAEGDESRAQLSAATDSSDEVAQLRRELALALSERDSALREAASLRGRRNGLRDGLAALLSGPGPSPPAANTSNRSSLPVTTELPTPGTTASGPAASPSTYPKAAALKSETPKGRRLAGTWFYVRPKGGQQNKNKALYPPEFIEIHIAETGGTLNGRFKARYHILDRPISPDVNFEFSGPDSAGSCQCFWRGIGGAKGQITLQLTGENSMRFDWTAANLGTQQGLASGTAVLTRRADSP